MKKYIVNRYIQENFMKNLIFNYRVTLKHDNRVS